MAEIDASNALYIKLGESGIWEADCIRDGTLRLGYRELPHEVCSQGRWEDAVAEARKWSKDQGAAGDRTTEIYRGPISGYIAVFGRISGHAGS